MMKAQLAASRPSSVARKLIQLFMIDVVIPPDRLSDVQSEACGQWLVEHARGSAIGHRDRSPFLIRFDSCRCSGVQRPLDRC
jgi:hypothetical protein